MKTEIPVYGEGGYDPTKPNNNIVETKKVDVPDPEPTAEERLAAIERAISSGDDFAAVRSALRSDPNSKV